jgi:hypothetical protein
VRFVLGCRPQRIRHSDWRTSGDSCGEEGDGKGSVCEAAGSSRKDSVHDGAGQALGIQREKISTGVDMESAWIVEGHRGGMP